MIFAENNCQDHDPYKSTHTSVDKATLGTLLDDALFSSPNAKYVGRIREKAFSGRWLFQGARARTPAFSKGVIRARDIASASKERAMEY